MIDPWCYRRWGHNEADEPSYTQPVMYREIGRAQECVRVPAYAERLKIAEGRVTEEALEEMKKEVIQRLDIGWDLSENVKPRQKVPSFGGVWKGLGRAPRNPADWNGAKTQVPRETLKKIAETIKTIPADFTVHPKLRCRILEGRYEMVQTGKNIDWGCAEMLAMGSLLLEEHNVRLTGQDVEPRHLQPPPRRLP